MKMKNIINLLKTAYNFKRYTKKCLKHGVGSEENVLAKYYEDYFNSLEDNETNSAHLDDIAKEIEKKQLQYKDSDDIQKLLSSMLQFISALKLVVR